MSPGIRLEGWVDNGRGAPLPGISAIVTRVDDGGIVTSGLTDAEGHWVFSGLSELDEYFVNLSDSAGNAIVRGPWSGELRTAFVRDRLALPDTGLAVLPNGGNTTVGGLPLVIDPDPLNTLEWRAGGMFTAGAVGLTEEAADLLYEPIDSAYTKAESDARYAELTDVDPFPQYLTPAEANALYMPIGAAVDAWTKAESDAKFVDVTGDTMSGSLAVVNSTSTRISQVRAAGSLQRPGIDFERWLTTVGTYGEVTVGSTIGTFGFNASGAATLAYGGSIYAYVDAPIVGGTAPIAFSFYHATLGETYRLDSQGRGWFAPPADTSIFPATPGLYISGKWVGVSATAGNVLTWNTDGFYVPTPVGGGGGLTLPLTAPLTFSPDNTHDIGAAGASRPNDLYLGGNVYLGTASRVLANFGAITASAGTAFQTNVTNGLTEVPALPNGSGTGAWWVAYNSSDPANAASGFFGVDGTVVWFGSQKFGSGTNLPMRFYVNAAERMGIATTGAVTIPGTLSVAGSPVITEASGDTRYVNTTGDTMSGLLTGEGAATSTVVFQAKLPADTQPRFTIRADGRLDWGGGAAVAVDVPMYRVSSGDFRIGANFSGSTNNTRDLGFTTVQWKAVYGNQLFLSGDGTSAPAWAASGAIRLRNAATGNIAWRNAGGTADLTLGANSSDQLVTNTAVIPDTTNSRDLGTTALRWRKLWAVDGEFTNVPTVGGVALLTPTAADTAYVNVGGDTMTGPLNINSSGTVAQTVRNSGADDNVQLRFKGNVAAVDQWAIGNNITGGSGRNFDIYDLVSGATRLRVSGATGVVDHPTGLSIASRPVIMAGCAVYHNAVQTITTGVLTALAFNTERFDTDSFHDTVTNNNRITIPAGMGGKYLIVGNIEWSPVADATWRVVGIRVNGTTQIARQAGPNLNSASLFTALNVTRTYDLAAGDYVELMARHERGSNLDVTATAGFGCEFTVQRIG